ncbi:MAG: Gfo/Idh/MocA family oxidoreductase, partial [Verrucomicrobia bacterium]|nr:Gfo/Idh/MocA family oxidoreductase [Verrucomicrobiota bacterium]
MNDIRIGIVGVGNMGSGHAKMLLDGKVPGAVLGAICDSKINRLGKFPECKSFNHHRAMIASGEVDAVIVATPHYDHAPIGVDVLNGGLHVIIEKPIAVTKRQAEPLLAAAAANPDRVFCAMFNQRTDTRYRKLKEMIDNGVLGRINRINWIITDWFRTEAYYAQGDWRATWSGEGGGVLMNQCPHQLDLWQWLFGMPNKLRAFTQLGRFHDIEVEDDVTAYFQYDNGTHGVFITTTGETPGTNRLEIAAENGKVVIEGSGIQFVRNAVPSSQFSKTAPGLFESPARENVEVEIVGVGEQHLGILKNFVAAIRGEAELLAPAEEGIRMIELANAMILSGLTGKTV